MHISHPITQIMMRGDVIALAPLYAVRMLQFGFLTAFKRKSIISMMFGSDPFRMNIEPLGAHEGSRGIFMFRERYEPLLRFGARFLRRGDSAIDLGANQGVFTSAFAAAVGSGGRVIAVEPLPWQAARVRANLALNGSSCGTVVEKAISDTIGKARLGIPDGDTSASLVSREHKRELEVETTTVDEIVEAHQIERLTLIKIDVEGAELMALRGAEQSLRKFHPALSLEASDRVEFGKIQEYLAKLGYRFSVYDRRGELHDMPKTYEWIDNVICTAAA